MNCIEYIEEREILRVHVQGNVFKFNFGNAICVYIDVYGLWQFSKHLEKCLVHIYV